MRTGKIYKLTCHATNKVYIGSTSYRWLCQRISSHIQHYKRYKKGQMHFLKSFLILENNNFTHETIEEINFESLAELREREQYWIERTENCINERKAYTSSIERQEYLKNYRKEHKDDEKRKEKIKCECGVEVRKSNITYHLKTKKHQKAMQ